MLVFFLQIKYDFIGKYESLGEDSRFVIDLINKTIANNSLPSSIHFPVDKRRESKRKEEVLTRYDVISSTKIRLLKQIYNDDLDMFGYNYTTSERGTLVDYFNTDTRCTDKD